MTRRFFLLLISSAMILSGISGCRHCCRRPACTTSAAPCVDPCPPGRLRPLHALLPQRIDVLPPQGGPAPATLLPAPPGAVPGVSGFGQPAAPLSDPTWRPAPGAVRWPDPAREPARLYPPESVEPPAAPPQPQPPQPQPPQPQPPRDRAAPPLPVGIPGFAKAKEGVGSGLKPSLEGLDWLQTNGYRTVLHIRRPGEDDGADRKQVEKRGLRYVSLELSPQTLSPDVVDQFNHLANEAASQPLFVYDRDSVLQGALWFLHFRIVDLATDDEARVRAGRLGLREDGGPEHRDMWLAVQKYWSGRSKP